MKVKKLWPITLRASGSLDGPEIRGVLGESIETLSQARVELDHRLRLEMNQHEVWSCAKTHGWTPRAGAASGVDQQKAETFQPIHEPAVDARGDPGPREELTTVCVPGKLQGDA